MSSEATADNIAKDNPVISPVELEPRSPTVLSPGSASSGGSTLVSGLPSPLPSHHKTPALDSVEENLSSVVNILKAKVEKEDSFSVDSFEVLSEEPEAGHSMDSQSEDLLGNENLFLVLVLGLHVSASVLLYLHRKVLRILTPFFGLVISRNHWCILC